MTYHALLTQFSKGQAKTGLPFAKNFAVLVLAILQLRTVCLYKLRTKAAAANGKEVQLDSSYKQLTRFFNRHKNSDKWLIIIKFIYEFLDRQCLRYLYLDGTEWEIGSTQIHILMLAVNFGNCAVPLYFEVYWHKGVLSQDVRTAFMQKATAMIKLQGSILIADREFIGDFWFLELTKMDIKFVIRLRKDQYKHCLAHNQSMLKARWRAQKKGKASQTIQIEGSDFYLWVLPNSATNKKEDFIYLLTNVAGLKKSGELYRQRWQIETCFKHLKTNGFNLEDLRMTDLGKIRLMLSLLACAYVLAVVHGIINPTSERVTTKKYRDQKSYPSISLFRLGYDFLLSSIITVSCLLACLLKLKKPKNPVVFQIPVPPDKVENVQ